MARVARASTLSRHHISVVGSAGGAPAHAASAECAILRPRNSSVVLAGDLLRHTASVDPAGAMARSAANHRRSHYGHGTGVLDRWPRELFHLAVLARGADGERDADEAWRVLSGGRGVRAVGHHGRAGSIWRDPADIADDAHAASAGILGAQQSAGIFCRRVPGEPVGAHA